MAADAQAAGRHLVRRLGRALERVVLGSLMSFVVFVIERRLLKAIRRRR